MHVCGIDNHLVQFRSDTAVRLTDLTSENKNTKSCELTPLAWMGEANGCTGATSIFSALRGRCMMETTTSHVLRCTVLNWRKSVSADAIDCANLSAYNQELQLGTILFASWGVWWRITLNTEGLLSFLCDIGQCPNYHQPIRMHKHIWATTYQYLSCEQ